MPDLHLQMFYESRQSIQISDSDPSTSPNTELPSVPEAAEIRFKDSPNRTIELGEYATEDGGVGVARFLISRAMYDPDAVVVPLN